MQYPILLLQSTLELVSLLLISSSFSYRNWPIIKRNRYSNHFTLVLHQFKISIHMFKITEHLRLAYTTEKFRFWSKYISNYKIWILCLLPTGLKFSGLSLHQPFLETVWYTDHCIPSQSSWLGRSGVRPENLHIWCLQVTPMMLAQGLDFKTKIFQKRECCKSSTSCPLFLSSPWSLKYLVSGLPPPPKKKKKTAG